MRGVHTHAQAACGDGVYVLREACAQRLPRSADAALPAGMPVEHTTRVFIIDGREC